MEARSRVTSSTKGNHTIVMLEEGMLQHTDMGPCRKACHVSAMFMPIVKRFPSLCLCSPDWMALIGTEMDKNDAIQWMFLCRNTA